MYLGSIPIASLARWSTRPDLSAPGLGLPDYNVGWPIHHGPSNKFKHHHYATASSPVLRGGEELCRLENTSPFLNKTQSLTEIQHWPKSEFELATEGEEDALVKSIFDDNSRASCVSEWSQSEESLLGGSAVLSKKSIEDEHTVERTRSDGLSIGGVEEENDGRRVVLRDGHDLIETELVYNRHAHEMKLALPVRSTKAVKQKEKQTGSSTVCRPSACRRRVHPVGKFADELVNWIPESETTDDERDKDNDKNDVEFGNCTKEEASKCNGSHIVHVHVKNNHKKMTDLSRHQPKRKRGAISVERREGGIRRRKQHNPWSIQETRMLIKGVSICGEGHWADIKRLDFYELASRSPVDLKDKWRNLLRLAQYSHNHSRSKKGEKRTDLPSDLLQQVRMLGTYQK